MSYELQYCGLPAPWKAVLEQTCVQANTCARAFDESPFWEVETTITALIASAANRCGFPALCETYIEREKQTEDARGENDPSKGRLDLFVDFGKKKAHWIEAKRPCILSADQCPTELSKRIRNGLNAAREQIQEAKNHAKINNGLMFAACYAPLRLSGKFYEKNEKTAREGFVCDWTNLLKAQNLKGAVIADTSKMKALKFSDGYRPFGLVIIMERVE